MVNNAGILRDASFVKMEEAQWDAIMHVHVKALYASTRPVFSWMKDHGGGGVIVNTTSTAGVRALADELAAARELDASNVEWIYDEGLLRAQIAGQAERAVVLLEDYIGKTKGQNPEREQILLGRVAVLKATAEMEQSGKPKQPTGDTPGARPVQ